MICIMRTKSSIYIGETALAILNPLESFLTSQGIESYIVGGYVRDGLIGKRSFDIDVVVSGNALDITKQVADALNGRFVPLDEAHQIARVVFPNTNGMYLDQCYTARKLIELLTTKRILT